MKARAALVFGVLAIVAGCTIAGVKIARADAGGACIYNATSAPIAGYPTLPACSSTRILSTAITGTTGLTATVNSWGDGTSVNTTTVGAAAFNIAYNGASWDRARTTQAFSGARVGLLAVGICDNNTGPCTSVLNAGAADGNSASVGTVMAASYGMGFNGSTWDRLRSRNGERQVQVGGNTRTKANATVCTSIATGASTLHKVWGSGSETATLTIYDEGASPTCAAADIVYSGSPTLTPLSYDTPMQNGIAYKLSASASVNDYITSN